MAPGIYQKLHHSAVNTESKRSLIICHEYLCLSSYHSVYKATHRKICAEEVCPHLSVSHTAASVLKPFDSW